MSLKTYNEKRDFSQTDEPEGKIDKKGKQRFVVQRHQATRLHYDLRLEIDGVLKSWAVPKGPSLNPKDKRLAVQTEDHPVKYIDFHGTIPKGNYGAGIMDIWDTGTFMPVDENHKKITDKKAVANLAKGELKFLIKGQKLNGEFVLVRLKGDEKNWLLIKHKDEFALDKYDSEKHLDYINKTEKATETVTSIRYGKGKKLTQFIKPMLASPSKEIFDLSLIHI